MVLPNCTSNAVFVVEEIIRTVAAIGGPGWREDGIRRRRDAIVVSRIVAVGDSYHCYGRILKGLE